MDTIGKILLMPKGTYSSSATYNHLDWVRYNGKAWVCKADNVTNVTPTEGATWTVLAEDGQSGGGGGGASEELIRDTVGWTGKNFLGAYFGSKWGASGAFETDSKATSTLKIAVNPSDVFIASKKSNTTSGKALLLRQYDSNGAYVSSVNALDWNELSKEYTVPSGIYYIAASQFSDEDASASVQQTYEFMFRRSDVEDSTYEPYHASVEDFMLPQSVMNVMGAKNLLIYPYAETTKTVNGITYTDNGDGSLTISGTATASDNFMFSSKSKTQSLMDRLKGKKVILSGGVSQNIKVQLWYEGLANAYADTTGDGVEFVFPDVNVNWNIAIVVLNGTAISTPITIKPMLRLAEYTDATYEPYAQTNRQLTTDKMSYYDNGILGAKNFLISSGSTTTNNGITFTKNNDGTITANGTATAEASFTVYNMSSESCPYNGYILNGCPSGGSASTYDLRVTDVTTSSSSDYGDGDGVEINVSATGKWQCLIIIRNGQTVNNIVFKPMIRLATDPDATYRQRAYTNIDLTKLLAGYTPVRDAALYAVNSAGDDTAIFHANEGSPHYIKGSSIAISSGELVKVYATIEHRTDYGTYYRVLEMPIEQFLYKSSVTLGTTETTVTFSSSIIKAGSPVELWCSNSSIQYKSIAAGSGSCVVKFPPQDSATSVTLRLYVKEW